MDDNDSENESEPLFSDLSSPDHLFVPNFSENVARNENAVLSVEDSQFDPVNRLASTMDESLLESTFNLDLPPEHKYLGDNLESVSGRVILSEGCSVSLPLLMMSYGTLVPGQTFPLTVRDRSRVSMLRECVSEDGDHTFGCIATKNYSNQSSELIGTTAEIYEFADDIGTIRIKAKARQRFRLLKYRRSEKGFYIGEVNILPEINLPKPLLSIQTASLRRLRTCQKERCQKWDAMLTRWPSWVFDQYDTEKLIDRVDKELTFLKQGLRQARGKIIMPKDPTELSFWIASHLDAEKRMFLIKLNSPVQRLRWLLSLMNKCQTYTCQMCDSVIGHQNEVFAMSIEGAQNTYVNIHGVTHETITLRHASNLIIVSQPSSEYSWFPGYAWRIANCRNCRAHIGWQFVAEKSTLRPRKFWGLTRQALKTKFPVDGQYEASMPVM